MLTVSVRASRRYDVHVDSGLLECCGELIASIHPPCKAALVTDSGVPTRWIEAAKASLTAAGFAVFLHVFPSGEHHKTLNTVGGLLEDFAACSLTRGDLIVALGGGIVGDVAGFAASCYLRGVPFVQLPTTLLATVDSSVGGKTGVNLATGKNLAGAFYQPSLVLCDTDTLSTLPPDTFADGAAECIKYALLGDAPLLELLQNGGLERTPGEIIARCVDLKRQLVERDERDTGDRQLLNLGHTAGHAIELVSNFTISHGHAVAMGMALIARAALRRGFCSSEVLDPLLAALAACGLPYRCPYPAAALCDAALRDKKRSGGVITLVVPATLGRAVLLPVPVEELPRWFADGLEEG